MREWRKKCKIRIRTEHMDLEKGCVTCSAQTINRVSTSECENYVFRIQNIHSLSADWWKAIVSHICIQSDGNENGRENVKSDSQMPRMLEFDGIYYFVAFIVVNLFDLFNDKYLNQVRRRSYLQSYIRYEYSTDEKRNKLKCDSMKEFWTEFWISKTRTTVVQNSLAWETHSGVAFNF